MTQLARVVVLERVIEKIKRRGIRRFEGEISVLELRGAVISRKVLLYTWENPIVLSWLKDPEGKVRGTEFRIEGKKFSALGARIRGDEETVDELVISLLDEYGVEHTLLWRGEGIMVFSNIWPEKRSVEVMRFYKLPFRKAKELLKQGYPLIGETNVAFELLVADAEELSNVLGKDVYEKVAHPLVLETGDPLAIYEGLREVTDPVIMATRIASYVLNIITTAEEVYERTLGIRLADSEKQEELMRKVGEMFWLEYPRLRSDPLLPPKAEFGEVVYKIWERVKDIYSPRERMNEAIKAVREELDMASIALSVAKRIYRASKKSA